MAWYALEIDSSIRFEPKTSESGLGVPEVLRRLEVALPGGFIYCFRAGRGVGVKIGAFLKGDGVEEDL